MKSQFVEHIQYRLSNILYNSSKNMKTLNFSKLDDMKITHLIDSNFIHSKNTVCFLIRNHLYLNLKRNDQDVKFSVIISMIILYIFMKFQALLSVNEITNLGANGLVRTGCTYTKILLFEMTGYVIYMTNGH